MKKHHPANKDLWENRHLYADETDPLPADMQLTIHPMTEEDELDEEHLATPDEALAALLDQYRKDYLFEQDRQTRIDLRAQIRRIEGELETRKINEQEVVIRKALSDPAPEGMSPEKAAADAAWRSMIRKKRAA